MNTAALSSQPWTFSEEHRNVRVLFQVPAPAPVPFVQPAVYGRRSMPAADAVLPRLHAPSALKISAVKDVILLPRNVVLSAGRFEILGPTFLRERTKIHGGVARIGKTDNFQLRYSPQSWDIKPVGKPVLFADTDRPGVHGHVLLEAITRLWALRHLDEGLVVATSVRMNRTYSKLFTQLGARKDDIIQINQPLHAAEVIFPDLPMLRRTWLHPETWEVFHALREMGRQSAIDTPERVYISRSRVAGRGLVNEPAVEDLFREKGFTIVHPQELPIEDQIRIFANARFLASAGGSAAHNALFAPQNARVLILSSDSWLVNADILLSQTPGRLAYVFGEPLERPVEGHRSQSDWRIDLSQVKAGIRGHFNIL